MQSLLSLLQHVLETRGGVWGHRAEWRGLLESWQVKTSHAHGLRELDVGGRSRISQLRDMIQGMNGFQVPTCRPWDEGVGCRWSKLEALRLRRYYISGMSSCLSLHLRM